MAVFVNSLPNHQTQMIGYRADGLKFDQNAPVIAAGQARYINQDHFGDNDWYIVVAYMTGASIPDRVGVTQAVEGGGGSLGITIAGTGFSLGGSGTSTVFYSSGLACIQSRPHELWQVIEDSSKEKWAFIPGGSYSSETLHGW